MNEDRGNGKHQPYVPITTPHSCQAAYRLAKRALNLSRRSHEDERAERLSQWQEAFLELENLAEDEQMTVRAFFDKSTTSSSRSQIAEKRVEMQEKLETTPSLDVADIDASLDRITTSIDTLANLQSEFLAKSSSGVSRMDPKRIGMSDALKHVTELERLYEGVREPTSRDIWRSPPEEEETSVLDEALEQVVPEEAFRESKAQKELTDEEGRIINQFLGTNPFEEIKEEMEEIFTPDQRPAMSRLENLIEATPDVRAIYQRALNMPSPSDHDACRELVMKMGVPVLEAGIPYEAEGLAASLANAGLVDFVGTEDSDVLAYEVSIGFKNVLTIADLRHPYFETCRARYNPSS
jgi:flap endonuclease-1